MAACRVYDSRHLLADCQEPGSAPEPHANRLWATFTFLPNRQQAQLYRSVTAQARFVRRNPPNYCKTARVAIQIKR